MCCRHGGVEKGPCPGAWLSAFSAAEAGDACTRAPAVAQAEEKSFTEARLRRAAVFDKEPVRALLRRVCRMARICRSLRQGASQGAPCPPGHAPAGAHGQPLLPAEGISLGVLQGRPSRLLIWYCLGEIP